MHDARGGRRRRPARRASGGASGAVERQDVAWRHRPDDLSPFSRGAGPGRAGAARCAGRHGVDAHRCACGRLEQAGVTGGLVDRRRASRSGCGPKVHHDPRCWRSSTRCATSASSRCARTPAARTCRSAGPTARPRSWCSASAARGRAASASSTPASPMAPDADEPARVAEAIDRMGLDHAVLTMVARDDLADGGMAHVAACVEAIRAPPPGDARRDADLRRQGRRGVARRCCSPRGPTCSTTTSRRSPGCSGPCARRPATPAACRCWPGPRRPG